MPHGRRDRTLTAPAEPVSTTIEDELADLASR
jgi:hypothetical protein